MQYLTHILGGKVAQAKDREYGNAGINIQDTADLFYGFDTKMPHTVWMSHGDRIDRMPEGFSVIADSNNSPLWQRWQTLLKKSWVFSFILK